MGQSLLNRIDKLCEDLDHLYDIREERDNPYESLNETKEILKLIPLLFEKIRHGEPGHEAWLQKAIECHFQGLPMPDYVAK